MRHRVQSDLLPSTPPAPLVSFARRLLLATVAGRALTLGLAVKAFVFLARQIGGTGASLMALLDRIGTLVLLVAGGILLFRLLRLARHRLLWRVRRKLILSYIFIGVVPSLLIVTFFVLCGLLLFFNVSSYLVQSRLRSLTEHAEFIAKATAIEIQRGTGPAAAGSVLARREASLQAEYPSGSMALVPTPTTGCAPVAGGSRTTRAAPGAQLPISDGPWAHLDPPTSLPPWVKCSGFGGVLAYVSYGETRADDDRQRSRSVRAGTPDDPNPNLEVQVARLAIRAAALPDGPSPAFAVIVDLPVDELIAERLKAETGIHLGRVSAVLGNAVGVHPAEGRPRSSSEAKAGAAAGTEGLDWVTLLDYTDWDTGHTALATQQIDLNIARVYDRLTSTQSRLGNQSFSQILILLLTVVAALFLIIEVVALIMGLALARSITGSVHELFTGTERVRHGDFTHKIKIEARDQLGELADSFNTMTASIEELLRQADEKKRLEEELRIARQIQMSLLPQGRLAMPGVSVTALCLPAREVGGDYYDFFPLDDQRLGILIADVSGKGTSAALYMAELKGLMLSLSQIHRSPRELMVSANQIMAANLDSQSFITMTYAIIDLAAATMTYARAGHTPLFHLPSDGGAPRAEMLVPDGLVLGLNIDRGEKFEQLLVEATVRLRPDDLFVFFTDGISEAMNAASDCFGESRLGRLLEEHGHLSGDELRERILREIEAFVGDAPQHDDMTLILLRVEALAVSAGEAALMDARRSSL